jgi:hypothetical protein
MANSPEKDRPSAASEADETRRSWTMEEDMLDLAHEHCSLEAIERIATSGAVEMGGTPPEYKIEMGAVPEGFRVEMGGK